MWGGRLASACVQGALRTPYDVTLSARGIAADLDLALLEVDPDDGVIDLVGLL